MTTDRIPAPRPVPTREDRMTEARTGPSFATYLDRHERDQLDARAATIDRLTAEMNEAMSILAKVGDAISPTGERPEEALGTLAADVRLVVDQRDDALDDRDNARAERDVYKAQVANLREQLARTNLGRKQLEEQLDGMVEHRDRLLRVAVGQAPKVRAAGQLAAIVREANELIDRALAAYDTTPGEEPPTVTITLDNSSGTFTPTSSAAPVPSRRAQEVLAEVAAERAAQDAKWGEQNHPDGTGGFQEEMEAHAAKMACQAADEGGYVDWLHILREEVAEAFAAVGPELRAELVQVAAVAVNWIEAIDRRATP